MIARIRQIERLCRIADLCYRRIKKSEIVNDARMGRASWMSSRSSSGEWAARWPTSPLPAPMAVARTLARRVCMLFCLGWGQRRFADAGSSTCHGECAMQAWQQPRLWSTTIGPSPPTCTMASAGPDCKRWQLCRSGREAWPSWLDLRQLSRKPSPELHPASSRIARRPTCCS